MIHIYCGDGKGKTTASIGLAVRCGGYGKKVLFMQFLKGSYTGELEVLGKCENIKVMLVMSVFDMAEFYATYIEEKIQNAISYAKYLKDRYNFLWLYYDLFGGRMNEA